MRDLLGRLSEAFGPSGCEDEVRRILHDELKEASDSLVIDPMGNLIASFGKGKEGPRAMIAAHMDEVGFIVDYIDDDGYLRFKKVGGIDDRILPATRVRVGDARVPGVIGIKPKHLQKGKENETVVASDDLMIDIGARTRVEAEERVRIGAYATFDTAFRSITADVVAGKALDDRAGCAMAAQVAWANCPSRSTSRSPSKRRSGCEGRRGRGGRGSPPTSRSSSKRRRARTCLIPTRAGARPCWERDLSSHFRTRRPSPTGDS